MRFLFKLITTAAAVFIVTHLLPGVSVDSALTALLVAVVLAFINSLVKPVLVLFTLPITILSLGLFLLVINALMILLAAKLVDGFKVDSFWHALLFSIILSLVNSILESIASPRKREEE